MARRDGFYSIRKTAREMCRLINIFAPIIRSLYPEAPALHAALAAAMAACEELRAQLDAEDTPGV